ncbi:hypothetical protein ACPA9J_14395 [Pseudomonas aeruginosa]
MQSCSRQVDCRLILDCSTTPTPANGLPCVPVGHLPAAPASVARPCLRGGPDRHHINFLGHHRPPESHRLHPRRHYRLCLGQSFLAFALSADPLPVTRRCPSMRRPWRIWGARRQRRAAAC